MLCQKLVVLILFYFFIIISHYRRHYSCAYIFPLLSRLTQINGWKTIQGSAVHFCRCQISSWTLVCWFLALFFLLVIVLEKWNIFEKFELHERSLQERSRQYLPSCGGSLKISQRLRNWWLKSYVVCTRLKYNPKEDKYNKNKKWK